jgi:3-deoxy-D-manno-octulosonic-acid transferase
MDSDAVYVANTLGEMGLWFRLAPVAMVGGSWAPVGGHNPHEPLALGCRVVHGPHVQNFAESYADLDAQGLSQLALDAAAIAHAVLAVWAQPSPAPTQPPSNKLALLHSLIELAKA